jgi:O-antigen/teichoic acid export membrane protein
MDSPELTEASRDIVSTGARVIGLRAFIYGIGFATNVLLARALGPEGRVIYALPAVITSILVVISHLSLEQSHVFLAARGIALRTLWANSLFATGLLGAGSWALTATLYALGGPELFGTLPVSWIAVCVSIVPLYLLTIYWTSLLQLDRRLAVAYRSFLAASLAQLGVCGALYAAQALTPFRALLTLFVYPTASSVLLLGASMRAGLAGARLDRPTLARSMAFGLKTHAGTLAYYMLLRFDALLVHRVLGFRELGLYSLATSLAEALWLLVEPLSAALLPHQVRAGRRDERQLAFATARMSVCFVVLAGTVCWIGAPYGFRFIYGPGFSDAAWPFRLLIPGVVALVIQRPLMPIVVKEGRPWLVSALGVSVLGLNIVMNLVLLRAVGIMGASIASSVCYTMLAAAYVLVTREHGVVGFKDLIPRSADVLRFLSRPAAELQ